MNVINRPAPLQTEDEVRMVKQYVITLIMLDVLEVEVRNLLDQHLKMSRIFIRKLQDIQKKLPMQIHHLHRRFKMHGIKIIEIIRTKTSVQTNYVCRGYAHEMILQGDIVKAEIELKLADDFGIDLLGGEDSS